MADSPAKLIEAQTGKAIGIISKVQKPFFETAGGTALRILGSVASAGIGPAVGMARNFGNTLDSVPGLAKTDWINQQRSPAEIAMEDAGGKSIRYRSIAGENRFWDLLYEEPCWINPLTNSLEISELGKLWCRWFMDDDIGQKLADALGGELHKLKIDEKKLKELWVKKVKDNWVPGWHSADYKEEKKTFKKALKAYYGVPDMDGLVQDTPELGKLNALADKLGTTADEIKEHAVTYQSPGPIGLLGLQPGDADNVESAGEGGIQSKCDRSKWIFCFLMKFILGPAGLIILKFMPYVVRFFLNFGSFFRKLFLGLMNFFYAPANKTPYPYINKYNQLVTNWKPGFRDTIITYLGLVIPWKFIDYDMGQKYGNGQFGKLIVSLMFLSLGLITMGSVTVVVLLIAFTYFCTKTLAVFTDNIETKKSK